MATVPLSFVPPDRSDVVILHIYESVDPLTVPFTEIEAVSAGTFPNYIRRYTTTLATDATDWFAIAWETSDGVISDLSDPIKGGSVTLVGELLDRVMIRIPDADENIVLQEAEAAIELVFKTGDPYSIDITTVNKVKLAALTDLIVVYSQYIDVVTRASSTQDYTAGMISQRSSSGGSKEILDALERLERRSLRRLGVGGSLIGAISERVLCGFTVTDIKTSFDSSRLLSTRAVITEEIVSQDIETAIPFITTDI